MTTALRPQATDEELLRHYQRRARQRQLTATTSDRQHWQVGKHQVIVRLLPNGKVHFDCNCATGLAAPCLHIAATINSISRDIGDHDA